MNQFVYNFLKASNCDTFTVIIVVIVYNILGIRWKTVVVWPPLAIPLFVWFPFSIIFTETINGTIQETSVHFIEARVMLNWTITT